MSKQQIGVVGMAVMGKNLALNIESRGYSVALFNRTGSKTTAVVEEHPDKNLKQLIQSKNLSIRSKTTSNPSNGKGWSGNGCNHPRITSAFR